MPKENKEGSEVQAITFDDKKFTTKSAKDWLDANGYTPIKRVHHSANRLRYRITDPSKYKRYITKVIGDKEIELVIGFKN